MCGWVDRWGCDPSPERRWDQPDDGVVSVVDLHAALSQLGLALSAADLELTVSTFGVEVYGVAMVDYQLLCRTVQQSDFDQYPPSPTHLTALGTRPDLSEIVHQEQQREVVERLMETILDAVERQRRVGLDIGLAFETKDARGDGVMDVHTFSETLESIGVNSPSGAELTALAEGLAYLREVDASTGPALLRPDSEYAIGIATGLSLPATNRGGKKRKSGVVARLTGAHTRSSPTL